MIMAQRSSDDTGICETLRGKDVFYKEVTETGRENKDLAQPLILLDPDLLVPHDLLNSFVYAMIRYIERFPD
jgi:hypothetical protein